ncbi:MAG TPA: HU family DNA-binding protein [Methylotenera sp.]|jgi:integration host factor subunit beta|nr:HU family DNA-binding protein [Methylotenera sp.]
MHKSKLILAISNRFPDLSEADIALAIKTMLAGMSNHLSRGGRIEIRRFGSFYAYARSARIARNPKTGEKVHVSARLAVRFKPSVELRKKVDNESTSPY